MDIPRDPRRAGAVLSRDALQRQRSADPRCLRPAFSASHAAPGQRKRDVEMPNEEIANFQEQRRPDRFFPGTTTLKPLHPIIIEGVPSMVQAGGHYE